MVGWAGARYLEIYAGAVGSAGKPCGIGGGRNGCAGFDGSAHLIDPLFIDDFCERRPLFRLNGMANGGFGDIQGQSHVIQRNVLGKMMIDKFLNAGNQGKFNAPHEPLNMDETGKRFDHVQERLLFISGNLGEI